MPFSLAKNAARTDKRISICVICRKGIFKDREDYEWLATSGYTHLRCKENEAKTSA